MIRWFLIVIVIAIMLFTLAVVVRAEEDIISQLIPHIITIESSWNEYAVSEAGAIGLCQITPIVLKEYKQWVANDWSREHNVIGVCTWEKQDLFNPENNIRLCKWYLKRIREHYLKDNFTIERMLAAYNGGPTRMRKLLREGKDWQDMPRESVSYVKKVMAIYAKNKN